MRLALVTSYYPPEVGSAAHLFFDLAHGFEKHGDAVRVFTTRPRRGKLSGEVTGLEEGSRTVASNDSRTVPVVRVKWPVAENLDSLAQAVEHFTTDVALGIRAGLSKDNDVFVVYSPPLPLAFTASLLGKIRARPVVVNVQDLYPQTAVDMGLVKNPVVLALLSWMERETYRLASHITAHSKGNADHIIAVVGRRDKVGVLYNWLDTARVSESSRENDFRKHRQLSNRFVVSYAGIISYLQDMEVILNAAAILRDEDEIVFIIAGSGPERTRVTDTLSRLQLGNVFVLPYLPREEYQDLLVASDVCLVTLKEAVQTPVVPGKLQAIMAAGRASIVAAPPVSDARSLVLANGCGMWIQAGDANALANAIRHIRDHPDEKIEMEKNARAAAKNLFSLDAAVTILHDLLSKLGSTQKE